MRGYHIDIFHSDEDGGYIADVPDLEACSAFGETPEEALRNLAEPARQRRLEELLEPGQIVEQAEAGPAHHEDRLPAKDRALLRAALHARATHLVTGDVTHFGSLFGERPGGLLVVSPGGYLRTRDSG
jgi:predicted RNase H-like HicB family nuclease